MTSWRFVVPLPPQGKQKTRHPSRRNAPLREAVAFLAASTMPSEPLAGPLRVDLLSVSQRPKAMQRRRDPDGLLWCPQKPDKDNIEKLVYDAMRDRWDDDKQVVAGDTLTTYTAKTGDLSSPQLVVRVTRLGTLNDDGPTPLASSLGLL